MPPKIMKDSGAPRSILIVSDSGNFDSVVKRSLKGFITIDTRKSGALARRCILERDYDIVVIKSPLPDETGEALAIDVAEKSDASVMIVIPQEFFEEIAEKVTDYGVFVISELSFRNYTDKSVRFLIAMQNRVIRFKQKLIKAEEKTEEVRIVSKAKLLLMEKKHMSEDDAHRFIGKVAMNNGISRRKAAEMILED